MILLLLFALPDRNNASAATRLSNYLSSVAAAKHLDLPCWHRERAMPPFFRDGLTAHDADPLISPPFRPLPVRLAQ